MAHRRNRRTPFWVSLLIFAAISAAMAFGSHGGTGTVAGPAPQSSSGSQPSGTEQDATSVYFLDVGQGDSELIRLKTGENILIDAGTPETAQELADYLADLGVSKIDCLIATHPHADHIGGMEQIVDRFSIGKIYMPRIPDSQIPTTATYEKLLTAIDRKGLKITAAKAGTVIFDTGEEKLEIFAPNSEKYGDLNSYSIVTMLTSGEKRFLFTGDAESDSEKEMVKKGYDLRCDVLKCGHHGSSTSTSAAFLKAAGPSAAVISCGLNNDYGHPHKEVVDRLKKAGVTIYRTDQEKTILAQCDGKTIRFTTGLKSVAG